MCEKWHFLAPSGREGKEEANETKRERGLLLISLIFFSSPFCSITPGRKRGEVCSRKKVGSKGLWHSKEKKGNRLLLLPLPFCLFLLEEIDFHYFQPLPSPTPKIKDLISPTPTPSKHPNPGSLLGSGDSDQRRGEKSFVSPSPHSLPLEDEIAASEFVLVFPEGKRRRTGQQHQKISSPSKERREKEKDARCLAESRPTLCLV